MGGITRHDHAWFIFGLTFTTLSFVGGIIGMWTLSTFYQAFVAIGVPVFWVGILILQPLYIGIVGTRRLIDEYIKAYYDPYYHPDEE